MRWSRLIIPGCLLLAASTNLKAGEYDDIYAYAHHGFKAGKEHDYQTARRNLDAAIQKYPKNHLAYFHRGLFLLIHHEYDGALSDFNKAVILKPAVWEYAHWRGVTYAKLGKYDLALADYNRVLSFHLGDQTQASIYNDRAWLEATCPDARYRNGNQAVKDAEFAVRFGHTNKVSYLNTLAAAYAETGDFDSAIKYEQQAIAAQAKNERLLDADDALNMYRQHRPYRDHPGKEKKKPNG
jgi:tetratricopeptide (TPR) repeat protein